MAKELWTLLSFLWLGVVLYLSFNQPSDTLQTSFFIHQDKAGHFIAYGVLFFLFTQSFRYHFQWLNFLSGALVISLILGILIEVLQGTLTIYRVSDWKDALANASGVLAVYYGYLKSNQYAQDTDKNP